MSSLLATFFIPPKGLLHGGLWIKKTESVYSPSQITKWLERIKYPGYACSAAHTDGSAARETTSSDLSSFSPSLENLELLMLSSLVTFPFRTRRCI
ncbi:hypothetical protein C8J56DRAFT_969780, partial [Mycena floridula]